MGESTRERCGEPLGWVALSGGPEHLPHESACGIGPHRLPLEDCGVCGRRTVSHGIFLDTSACGKLAFGRRLRTSQLTAQVERKDGGGSDRKTLEAPERTEPAKPWGDGGSGDNRLLQTLEFVIGSTFSSRLYVGGKELHVALPLPRPHDYPTWFPAILRLPQAVYDAAERGLDEGWITKAEDDSVFAIKYGVLRSEVRPLPDEDCEPCQRAKRMELEAAAARDLVNIDRNERSRRINTGYAGLAVSSVLAYLAIDLDGGPLARFPAAFLAVLAYAFVESGKTGL